MTALHTWIPCVWRLSGRRDVTICMVARRDAPDLFVVRRDGDTLNRNGEWEREPIPSERSDAYLRRTRFSTLEEAKDTYERHES